MLRAIGVQEREREPADDDDDDDTFRGEAPFAGSVNCSTGSSLNLLAAALPVPFRRASSGPFRGRSNAIGNGIAARSKSESKGLSLVQSELELEEQGEQNAMRWRRRRRKVARQEPALVTLVTAVLVSCCWHTLWRRFVWRGREETHDQRSLAEPELGTPTIRLSPTLAFVESRLWGSSSVLDKSALPLRSKLSCGPYIGKSLWRYWPALYGPIYI